MATSSFARRALVAAALLACASGTFQASSPKSFTAATQADFLKGDLQNLSVDTRGQLTLGPASDVVYETPSPFLWTVVPSPDGTLYVGTGNDGRVYKIDAQGRGSQFFDATELEIHAIALAPNGAIYAASSPDGKIYRIDRNGNATTFFDPEQKYIWSLATDAKGNIYAATGERGVVYKITPDGKGALFYDTKATHATALAVDKTGNLLVGTESPGRVFRVDASGKGFLVLDTPYQEVRALKFDDKGVLFVAAANGRPNSNSAPSTPGDSTPQATGGASTGAPVASVTVSTEITAVVVDAASAGTSAGTTRPSSGASKGGIYRIATDGLWDQLWDSREDLPYDIAFDGEGRLIVATGDKGKIYRLEGDPARPMLLARASASQVTSLYRDARGRVYFATANPGKLSRLSAERAPRGTYESEVRDAQQVSSWGTITWRGTATGANRIEVSTRSGNTETPDDAWSDWSTVYAAPGSPITSPKARYLQWRAVLSGTGDGPALTSVTGAYLPRNMRPQVRSVTVHPPGIVFQKPYSTGDPDLAGFDNQTTPERKLTQAAQTQAAGSSLGRRTYQKGLQTLQWRAEDENEDELSYDVQYRREGDSTWKTLRSHVAESILVWDTTTVPNGTYFVRVIASDAPSNSAASALSGELESAAFDIDNTPPSFSQPSVRADGARTLVAFDVRDDYSSIQRVEYSVDGEEWKAVFPTDGIADSRSEHYELALDGRIGPRGLTLRAMDAMNNVSTTQVDAPAATR
jgi:sugar lactone lactonase YvrE